MASSTRPIQLVLTIAAVTLALFVFVEGCSSLLVAGHQLLTKSPVAERAHTEYDAELGWINVPNVFVEDMYGPGAHLTTNSQRFRGTRDVSPQVPDGKTRIVCVGDSFTLGYGVGDADTWCQKLTHFDQRLETVNLGQGGYGVDQAYLWYMRNQAILDHDVLIFAFITDDFRRMQSDTFQGYGKPLLEVRNDALVQANRPVPRRAYYVPWATTAIQNLASLRTFRLIQGIAGELPPETTRPANAGKSVSAEKVASAIFRELEKSGRERQRLLILVYLPWLNDYMGLDPDTSRWREFVHAEADKNGYVLVDVVHELRTVHPTRVKDLFRGHYSVEGNEYVAEVLLQRLREAAVIPGALQ